MASGGTAGKGRTISSVMVSWAVLERLAEPGRLAFGSCGGRGGASSVLGAIRGRVLSPLMRAISFFQLALFG